MEIAVSLTWRSPDDGARGAGDARTLRAVCGACCCYTITNTRINIFVEVENVKVRASSLRNVDMHYEAYVCTAQRYFTIYYKWLVRARAIIYLDLERGLWVALGGYGVLRSLELPATLTGCDIQNH